MTSEGRKDISQLFREGTAIDAAIAAAAEDAVLRHKQSGQPLVIWREGKSVLVPPEEIEIPRQGANSADVTPSSQ